MRNSDWSSDVSSSDLCSAGLLGRQPRHLANISFGHYRPTFACPPHSACRIARIATDDDIRIMHFQQCASKREPFKAAGHPVAAGIPDLARRGIELELEGIILSYHALHLASSLLRTYRQTKTGEQTERKEWGRRG